LQRHTELQPEIEKREESIASGRRSAPDLKPLCSQPTLDLIASFQHAVVEDLVTRTLSAAERNRAKSVLVSGGVAANRELRTRFELEGTRRNLETYFPSRALSTDNAAMIAAAGYVRYASGLFDGSTLNADPNLSLV
jgi:N6-L-threonylcarbamoyladenine synthase